MPALYANIEILQGDDYANADGRRIEFTEPAEGDWPDLAGVTISFTAKSLTTNAAAFTKSAGVIPGTPQKVGVELTGQETGGLDATLHEYRVDALPGPRQVTLVLGRMSVRKSLA